ncbi:BLUF domain-containing protein [Oceanobacter sp. 5_MG-2023]|uniref:BLUF domain-containing protein n=1 Tax=Oceanobacter sp. 5_MG-2023 TaxID=3062645 RepID=UPI0026E18AFB|nr:BLUF domain-containing protein [Oceanobacter sp. 5_MG-2023]MDO6682614.1 BLUF domain-containing protein [Oceanobacter sp. 5_MG-2023]
MKRIGCIGTLQTGAFDNHSAYILDIFNELRSYRLSHESNGIFIAFDDNFLLILEGNPDSLATNLYRIRRDHRIKYISILFNQNINKVIFTHWRLKFFDKQSEAHADYLFNLRKKVIPSITLGSPEDQLIFDTFFPSAKPPEPPEHSHPSISEASPLACTKSPQSPASIDFEHKLLSLSAWPKPTQLQLTPPIMKTCSLLSHHKISYQTLYNKGIWASETELKALLSALIKLGVLIVNEAPAEQHLKVAEKSVSQPAPLDRFGSLMKRFLTSSRKAM